jgi:hypothetical protein
MLSFDRVRATLLTTGVLFLGTSAGAPAGETGFTTNPAYRHLVKNALGIRTLSSDIAVQTKLRGFPPISLTLHGHSYFEAPDKTATVFDDVPGPLKKMISDSPSIAPAMTWPEVYDVTIASQEAGKTTFHLVPKDADSKLDHIDAVVSDSTGLADEYDFASKDGATTTTYNTYVRISGHELVASQTGVSRGHGYHADVSTSFSNYQINGDLPPGAFGN